MNTGPIISSWDLLLFFTLPKLAEAITWVAGFTASISMLVLIFTYFWRISIVDEEKKYKDVRDLSKHEKEEEEKTGNRTLTDNFKWATRQIWITLAIIIISWPTWIISANFPTQKELAAIYIVPKLATYENVDSLKGEAREVYLLFKDWLKDVAAPAVKDGAGKTADIVGAALKAGVNEAVKDAAAPAK